jgi:hypothetical protein
VRWFCPDVFHGQAVYVEGEIEESDHEQPAYIVVDRSTGEVIEGEAVTPVTPAPANGNGHETPPLISDAQMKMFHALGTKFYADEWNDKRPQLVGYITGGRTVSSKQLKVIEATKLLDGLRKKIDERDAAEADEDDVFDGAGPHDTEAAPVQRRTRKVESEIERDLDSIEMKHHGTYETSMAMRDGT